MTARVRAELEASEHADALSRLLATVDHAGPEPNLEELLSSARALAAVAAKGPVHGLTQTELKELDSAISSSVGGLVSVELPARSTPYRLLASWAGAVPRARPVEIFTTNYDLLMEQALEEVRVPFFDGFVGSRQPFFDIAAMEHDEVPTRWVRLWKLHGSVNWRLDGAGTVTRVLGPPDGAGALIHPSHLKYEQSRRMPYLAMIDRLRAFLQARGAALMICGYSFNDEHLNEVLVQGLEGNPTAAAFGLLHGELAGYGRARALALKRSNLSLMGADAAIIGTREARWSVPEDGPEGEASTEKDGNTSAQTGAPVFDLGDFDAFGAMLGEMIGEQAVHKAIDVD